MKDVYLGDDVVPVRSIRGIRSLFKEYIDDEQFANIYCRVNNLVDDMCWWKEDRYMDEELEAWSKFYGELHKNFLIRLERYEKKENYYETRVAFFKSFGYIQNNEWVNFQRWVKIEPCDTDDRCTYGSQVFFREKEN